MQDGGHQERQRIVMESSVQVPQPTVIHHRMLARMQLYLNSGMVGLGRSELRPKCAWMAAERACCVHNGQGNQASSALGYSQNLHAVLTALPLSRKLFAGSRLAQRAPASKLSLNFQLSKRLCVCASDLQLALFWLRGLPGTNPEPDSELQCSTPVYPGHHE